MSRTLYVGKLSVVAALFASIGLLLTSSPAPASAATHRGFCYTGFSYGTRAFVGTTITSGPSAPSQIGCTRGAPLARSNSMAHVDLARTVSAGVLDTTARTRSTPVLARSAAVVHGLNLLDGAVTAAVVTSESTTAYGPHGFSVSDAGTRFVGLRVLGAPVVLGSRRDVRLALPGIGYVVLDQQTTLRRATLASLVIDAVHVVVTATNVPGVAADTNVLVAHAMSGLQGPVVGLLGGASYGTSVTVGRVIHSGPSFLNPMPCLGSRGALFVRGGAGVAEAGALVTGTDRNTVEGIAGPSAATGTVTSTVQRVSLLSGIVQATVVRATARITDVHGTVHVSDPGSSFASLSVAGFPAINADVPTNTVVALPGLGTLYLHRVIRTPSSIEVRMLELVVTQTNGLGLAVGTDLRVAVARVSVR